MPVAQQPVRVICRGADSQPLVGAEVTAKLIEPDKSNDGYFPAQRLDGVTGSDGSFTFLLYPSALLDNRTKYNFKGRFDGGRILDVEVEVPDLGTTADLDDIDVNTETLSTSYDQATLNILVNNRVLAENALTEIQTIQSLFSVDGDAIAAAVASTSTDASTAISQANIATSKAAEADADASAAASALVQITVLDLQVTNNAAAAQSSANAAALSLTDVQTETITSTENVTQTTADVAAIAANVVTISNFAIQVSSDAATVALGVIDADAAVQAKTDAEVALALTIVARDASISSKDLAQAAATSTLGAVDTTNTNAAATANHVLATNADKLVTNAAVVSVTNLSSQVTTDAALVATNTLATTQAKDDAESALSFTSAEKNAAVVAKDAAEAAATQTTSDAAATNSDVSTTAAAAIVTGNDSDNTSANVVTITVLASQVNGDAATVLSDKNVTIVAKDATLLAQSATETARDEAVAAKDLAVAAAGGGVISLNGQIGAVDLTGTYEPANNNIQAHISSAHVTSVNGESGAVTLNADDINDDATAHKFLTQSLIDKLNSIDTAHYGAPLQSVAELAALSQSNPDKQRRYVEDETSDYFYDATAVSGDVTPLDQTGGTGFWKKVAVDGETATSIKTKYESNPDTNVFTDQNQLDLAAHKTKLIGIEAGSKDDQNASEVPFDNTGSELTATDTEAAIKEAATLGGGGGSFELPTVDKSYSGVTAVRECSQSLSFGEVVGPNVTDGRLGKSNLTSNRPAIGLVVADVTFNNDCTVLTSGYIRDDSWSWYPGTAVFLTDSSAGALTQFPSNTTNYGTLSVGVAVAANIIFVNPSHQFGIPSDGVAGQVLTVPFTEDFRVKWEDPSSGGAEIEVRGELTADINLANSDKQIQLIKISNSNTYNLYLPVASSAVNKTFVFYCYDDVTATNNYGTFNIRLFSTTDDLARLSVGQSVTYHSDGTDWHTLTTGSSSSSSPSHFERITTFGFGSRARSAGTAFGYNADGTINAAAFGFNANGNSTGAAFGHSANGSDNGAAYGYNTSGYSKGSAFGYNANGWNYGASVGNSSKGYGYGAAHGHLAEGTDSGAALGESSDGSNYGAAFGRQSYAYDNGAAVGYLSEADANGSALGRSANGRNNALALGYYADANNKAFSIAFGVQSEVTRFGEINTNINGSTSDNHFHGGQGWSGTTSSVALTEIFCAGISNQRCTIKTSSAYFFEVKVVGIDTVAMESCAYKFTGLIQRDDAGNTTIVGARTKTVVAEGNVSFDADVVADDTNEALIINVTAPAVNLTRWSASGEFVEAVL